MQLGAYLVLFCSAEADAAYAPLSTFEPFMPFRDPTCGISTYRLTVLDCIRVRNLVLQPFSYLFSHAPPSYFWTHCCNGLLNTYHTLVWALKCGLGYFESAPCRLDWLQQLQPRRVRVLWAGDFHLPYFWALSLSELHDETTDERCQKSKILTCLFYWIGWEWRS